jgi:alkylation response protein AidB-like acyl-CoA dehydrogenase
MHVEPATVRSGDDLARAIDAAGDGAARRDHDRSLPYDEIGALLRAGFGELRVPASLGGPERSVPALADALIALAAADSNLAQIFRGHIGLVELLRLWPATPGSQELLRAAGSGAFFGPAGTERGTTDLRTITTKLVERDGALLLFGEKYYTTGSLFADWLHVLVADGERLVSVVLPRRSPGVSVVDDWDGFGQRLTASGTAVFDGAPVAANHVFANEDPATNDYIDALYQFVHSATQAGIAQRLADDLSDLVRARTRSYPLASTPWPTEDPQVLEVVGEVHARAFGARAAVLTLAESLQRYAAAPAGPGAAAALERAVVESAATQVLNTKLLGEATWMFFDAASASAVQAPLALDRHWRNARAISSHNPAIYKAALIGGHAVNHTLPGGYLNTVSRDSEER